MPLPEAENVIRDWGPLADVLWPFSGKHERASLCASHRSRYSKTLSVDSIFSFVPNNKFSRFAKFCDDTSAATVFGRIGIFKLEANE